MINLKALALTTVLALSSATPALALTYPGSTNSPTNTTPTRVANCWFDNGKELAADFCQNSKKVDSEGDMVHTIRQGGDYIQVVLWENGNASVSYNGGDWVNDWEWTRDDQGDYLVGAQADSNYTFGFTAAK
jgi:hypothetical protein